MRVIKMTAGRLARRILPTLDIILVPFVYPAAWLLKKFRQVGPRRLPHCRNALIRAGVFPIRSHYYEPQFDYRETTIDFSRDRSLPGIDWNISGQLDLLSRLTFASELADIPTSRPNPLSFHLKNGMFEAGDAEYLYQLIRSIKPRRIYEIGSGSSTLMAMRAIRRNHELDPHYECKHVCIEPYESPWLEEAGVTVVRKKVEDLPIAFFSALEENDILFIDSSHIIRPHGDVLFEYLELLPQLNIGVVVHIHDIFSPKNYSRQWIVDDVRLWNEQYVLEAFLTENQNWKILGALNYLQHHHYDELCAVAPYLTPNREPGSFYIQKVG
jgi:predicted O-methyltransferase YrrM